jgi:hypothetical protein
VWRLRTAARKAPMRREHGCEVNEEEKKKKTKKEKTGKNRCEFCHRHLLSRI